MITFFFETVICVPRFLTVFAFLTQTLGFNQQSPPRSLCLSVYKHNPTSEVIFFPAHANRFFSCGLLWLALLNVLCETVAFVAPPFVQGCWRCSPTGDDRMVPFLSLSSAFPYDPAFPLVTFLVFFSRKQWFFHVAFFKPARPRGSESLPYCFS